MHTNCDVSYSTSVLIYDLYVSARFCLFTMSCTFYVSEIKVKQTNKHTHTHTHTHTHIYMYTYVCFYFT